jgi:hypothetical protein
MLTARSAERSADLFAQAQELLPGGVDSPVRAFRAVGGTPRFIARGQGAAVWDVDGNRYIDYLGSWGPLIVGHAHPGVVAAATCERCDRPVCISCAIPVRGAVIGAECLPADFGTAPPVEPPAVRPLLDAAGVAVPSPIARTDDAILMSYVGDEDVAAPQLHRYRPTGAEAHELFDQLVRAVERMLYVNVIHGDLSPFNVLVWDGRATVIDLPQAVDPRKNRHARTLLERDVARICDHFERFGVRSDARRIAGDLWTAWTFADLVPEELRGMI